MNLYQSPFTVFEILLCIKVRVACELAFEIESRVARFKLQLLVASYELITASCSKNMQSQTWRRFILPFSAVSLTNYSIILPIKETV